MPEKTPSILKSFHFAIFWRSLLWKLFLQIFNSCKFKKLESLGNCLSVTPLHRPASIFFDQSKKFACPTEFDRTLDKTSECAWTSVKCESLCDNIYVSTNWQWFTTLQGRGPKKYTYNLSTLWHCLNVRYRVFHKINFSSDLQTSRIFTDLSGWRIFGSESLTYAAVTSLLLHQLPNRLRAEVCFSLVETSNFQFSNFLRSLSRSLSLSLTHRHAYTYTHAYIRRDCTYWKMLLYTTRL